MALPTLDVHLTEADADAALREDAREALTSTPKVLRPQWLYDARGSELFEQITAQPEYYPFAAEREALVRSADEIARSAAADTLVELGSGSSSKTPVLLDAMSRAGLLRRYIPVDVSASILEEAVPGLVSGYPELDVHGVVGDFTTDLRSIPHEGRRMVCLLGGTIGNFEPTDRRRFLTALAGALEPGEKFLVGTDLVKDPETIVRAYDDAAGVTAAFELNALRARRAMTVRVRELDLEVSFAEGEEMRTEISTKFTRDRVRAELAAVGFSHDGWFTDPAGRFALSLATRV
jgi:L-histidine Nalpha-methyltransferase